ncbi:MAG TPA: N-6 DNA methylase [Limnochordia bacterium]|nr:N-6 DNA methylase [Limnochordia bacterium]
MNRELKREKYESLKHFDFSECESLIMASIKESNLDSKQILSHKVAIAALALLFKQIRNNAALIDFVDKNICDETTRSFLKKIANKFNNLIEELSRKFSDDVLQALTLYVEPRLFSEVSEYATPVGISKLAIRLLELKENDILLDMGSGVNSFLIEAALDNECKAFYGVEINTDNVVIGNIRTFILNLPIKIIQGNILSQDHAHLKANKVFSNHPLGLRLRDVDDFLNKNQRLIKYFKHAKRTISTDWVFTMAAYLNMDRPGKTIVLMSNAGTWNKPDEGLRKLLVEEGVVEGIVLLPARLMSSTAMSLTMMILSDNNKTVKMVDASEIYTEGRRQNSLEEQDISRIVNAYFNDSQISKGVTVEEIANNDYILNPQRYIGLELGFDNRITLAEVSASINRGVMITSNELDEIATKEETNYRYLMLGNINDGVIDSRLPCLTHIDEKYKKYCIKDGNLIISKNSPFKVALASVDEDEHILAAGNLYFIELDETRVNPVFVSVFMQSEAGMAQLHRFAKGGILKSISIQDLKKIEIPNIPREQQDRIAEEYLQLKDQLNVLQRQMDLVRDRMDRILEGVL